MYRQWAGQRIFAGMVMTAAIAPTLAAVHAGAVEKPAAQDGAAAAKDGWKPLFNGQSLAGWKRTEFIKGGEVAVDKAFRGGAPAIVTTAGPSLSGFHWTGDAPKTNYEIALETMKIKGDDFMCGLTFPVGESHASFIVGGWGGGVVGISNIDTQDASENPTTKFMSFKPDTWYKVRVRVAPKKIEAWLDDKQVVDQEITGRKISLRPGEIFKSTPIGICTYQTTAAYRDIRLRTLGK